MRSGAGVSVWGTEAAQEAGQRSLDETRAISDQRGPSGAGRSRAEARPHALDGRTARRHVGLRHEPRVPEGVARVLAESIRLAQNGGFAQPVLAVQGRGRWRPDPFHSRAGAGTGAVAAAPSSRLA